MTALRFFSRDTLRPRHIPTDCVKPCFAPFRTLLLCSSDDFCERLRLTPAARAPVFLLIETFRRDPFPVGRCFEFLLPRVCVLRAQ